MNLFSSRPSRRRSVWMLLFVWFFTLSSGWANACLLQERATYGHGPSEGGPIVAQVARISPGHGGVDSDHAENTGLAKGACLKVCGDSTQAVVTPASSADVADGAMLHPMAPAWADALDDAEQAIAWLDRPAPSPGVPLRTRFARLAL